MKEKKVLSMFITAAVTLVVSLAVTFGVMLTLADPVVATGIERFSYTLTSESDSSSIAIDLTDPVRPLFSLKRSIVYQPSGQLAWEGDKTVWSLKPKDKDEATYKPSYEDDIIYADESIASKVKVIPVRISNPSQTQAEILLTVEKTGTDPSGILLSNYTFVKLYNFADHTYDTSSDGVKTYYIPANESLEIAVVLYVNEDDNLTTNRINWDANPFEMVNVNVKLVNPLG